MRDLALLDNDIVIKVSCFDLRPSLAQALGERVAPARLRVTEFVARRKVAKRLALNDAPAALARLEETLSWAAIVEPTDAETALATKFEELAQARNISFDPGESLLLAMLLLRSAPLLITGDKRAIVGLGAILGATDVAFDASERLVCLEQVLLMALDLLGLDQLVTRVCAEPAVDTTARICCACVGGGSKSLEDVVACLNSNVGDLRRQSGNVLRS